MTNLHITQKQLEILNYLYKYRFLNRYHIQQLLNHKDPKRINTWLKDLHQKKIIGRHYSTKIGENTKPAIYYLTSKSKALLTVQDTKYKNINRVYREHVRSKQFIDKALFIADIYFYLLSSLTPKQSLTFFTKSDLENFNYLPLPLPDAYITIGDQNNTKRYFLDIFVENTPRFVLRNRIVKYCEYFQNNYWQKNSPHQFPNILLILPDNKTKDYMLSFISRYLEKELIEEISFFVTTKEEVEKTQLRENVWEKVVE